MEIDFEVGAKIDIATGKDVGDIRDDIRNLGRRKPFFNSSISSGNIPVGNAPLALDLGSPATGRIWNILGVTVLGIDDATALANAKAALYVDTDAQAPGLAQCVVPGLTIPSFYGNSDDLFWCHAQGNVVVNITGTATVGSPVIAKVYYADYPEWAVAGNSGR